VVANSHLTGAKAIPAEVSGNSVDTEARAMVRAVGARIRQLRGQRGMTLQNVARETGVSVSMLSMIERGAATPSIGTLVAVSSALGTHMSDLFDLAQPAEQSPIRRLADQVVVETAAGVLRRIVHNDPARGLEMAVNEYEPGTASGASPVHHVGTEYGVVLTGSLTVEIGGVPHVLRPGDGITYPSTSPHRIGNNSRTYARAVWVNLDS
jgi:transcriptional regulator with XRE-family HTH domain